MIVKVKSGERSSARNMMSYDMLTQLTCISVNADVKFMVHTRWKLCPPRVTVVVLPAKGEHDVGSADARLNVVARTAVMHATQMVTFSAAASWLPCFIASHSHVPQLFVTYVRAVTRKQRGKSSACELAQDQPLAPCQVGLARAARVCVACMRRGQLPTTKASMLQRFGACKCSSMSVPLQPMGSGPIYVCRQGPRTRACRASVPAVKDCHDCRTPGVVHTLAPPTWRTHSLTHSLTHSHTDSSPTVDEAVGGCTTAFESLAHPSVAREVQLMSVEGTSTSTVAVCSAVK
jgi:hypothetical protein